jgi:hypothetical protein
MKKTLVTTAILRTLLLAAALPMATAAQTAGMDPQAERLLKAPTDFLSAQKQFTVDTASTLDVVLKTGQKIQYDHRATLSVQRPNKLKAHRGGDLIDQIFYYDGKSLTLYNPAEKYFAASPAPGTLEDMLAFAQDKLNVFAPAGDLICSNAYEILMQDVTSGFVVGKAVVDGVRCDHLAFRKAGVDFQIWIQEGAQSLPRKLVLTTTDLPASPQFSILLTNWNLNPAFDAKLFEFTPPKDAKQIEWLPAAPSGTQGK